MKLVFLLLFIFFQLFVYGQEKNYKITYRHNLQLDTLKTLIDTIGKEAILIGNAIESNYGFAKKAKDYIPAKNDSKTFDQILDAKTSGRAIITSKGATYDSIGNMVHHDRKSQTISVREKMMNEYVVTTEKDPVINWIISDETRRIQNYDCKKATAHFRGRDYTAWFTTDVPIVAAPWKFFGLPGLLMDIEDDRHQVKIYVEKIEYPATEKVPGFVASGTKITMEKYFDFRNEEFKKKLRGMETVLMQQDKMHESIDLGGKAPTVKSNSTLYSIELRLDN